MTNHKKRERNMKILIDTYDTAFQNVSGGVRNRILSVVEALKNAGVSVDYFNKYETNIRDYDILHVFMLKDDSYSLIKYAKENGLKVVLSSIVTLSGKLQLRYYWWLRRLPIMTTYKLLFKICNIVDTIIAETDQEARFLEKYYHVSKDRIVVIPNGADRMSTDSKMIYEAIGKICDYALEVGRFDKNKNQLAVIKALKDTDIEMVFIGGESSSEPEYYAECLTAAGDCSNIHFLGWLDREDKLLKSAYCNAKAIVSSSYNETFGLTIIEGIMAGAIPVISNTLPILDYESLKKCVTFSPSDENDIRRKISEVMDSNDPYIVKNIKKKVMSEFSWEEVAKKHLEIYGVLQ